MIIHVNGEAREVTASRTVAKLVAELQLPAPAILVEHNGVALHRSEWDTQTIAEGDRFEILRVVAGG